MKLQVLSTEASTCQHLKLHFQIPYHKRPGSKMSVERNSLYLPITERQEGKKKGKKKIIFYV